MILAAAKELQKRLPKKAAKPKTWHDLTPTIRGQYLKIAHAMLEAALGAHD